MILEKEVLDVLFHNIYFLFSKFRLKSQEYQTLSKNLVKLAKKTAIRTIKWDGGSNIFSCCNYQETLYIFQKEKGNYYLAIN